MSSLQWPSAPGSTGPLYQYQFDAMGRVNTMVDSSSGLPVATATYTVANQLLGLTYFGMTENRDYNSLLQLTGQSVSGMFLGSVINLHYYYPYGTNNGLISSSSDSHLSETLSYTYDSLNHLSKVDASTGWSQSYKYDGFGNMTYKQGAGPYPDYTPSFDGSNHQVGMGYDANGNQTSNGTYDVSNRLVTNTSGESYAYDYRGKRIVKWMSGGGSELYVYGIDGKKLTTIVGCYSSLTYCGGAKYNVYFKGKLIQAGGQVVVTDRNGSVRWSGSGGTATWSSYYPYGEERLPTTVDDREKFGTYTRDNPGQDYADQRYYGVGTGRFWSVDPGGIATADNATPASLNRYSYVQGDPVNFIDPHGMLGENPNDPVTAQHCIDNPDDPACYGPCGSGGLPMTAMFRTLNPMVDVDPGCGPVGGPEPAPPASPPQCASTLSGQLPPTGSAEYMAVTRILNENGYTYIDSANFPDLTRGDVFKTDIYLYSVLYNRIQLSKKRATWAYFRSPNLGAAVSQTDKDGSRAVGIGIYNQAISSSASSWQCADLTDALNTFQAVFGPGGGSVNPNIYYWFALSQNTPDNNSTVIGATIFELWYPPKH